MPPGVSGPTTNAHRAGSEENPKPRRLLGDLPPRLLSTPKGINSSAGSPYMKITNHSGAPFIAYAMNGFHSAEGRSEGSAGATELLSPPCGQVQLSVPFTPKPSKIPSKNPCQARKQTNPFTTSNIQVPINYPPPATINLHPLQLIEMAKGPEPIRGLPISTANRSTRLTSMY
jgi:hypothetical protein